MTLIVDNNLQYSNFLSVRHIGNEVFSGSANLKSPLLYTEPVVIGENNVDGTDVYELGMLCECGVDVNLSTLFNQHVVNKSTKNSFVLEGLLYFNSTDPIAMFKLPMSSYFLGNEGALACTCKGLQRHGIQDISGVYERLSEVNSSLHKVSNNFNSGYTSYMFSTKQTPAVLEYTTNDYNPSLLFKSASITYIVPKVFYDQGYRYSSEVLPTEFFPESSTIYSPDNDYYYSTEINPPMVDIKVNGTLYEHE